MGLDTAMDEAAKSDVAADDRARLNIAPMGSTPFIASKPAKMHELSRRGLIAAGLSAGLLSTNLLAACSDDNGRTLRATEILPENFPTSLAIIEMDRLIRAKTNQRLAIKLYAGAQLGSERDTLELATFGGVDITRVAIAPLNSIEAMTIIPSLPFIFANVAHMRGAMDGAPGRAVLDALTRHGLIGLCFYDSGARSFYNTKRPIYTPDDMNGLKIRVQNSDLFVSLVESLGANPTPMPLGEVYQALVQGVIDGAENNWPSYQDGRHYEVARYYSLTRHVIAPEVLVMSAKTWQSLNAADQAVIMESARESVPYMRTIWDQRVVESEKIIRASNVEVNQIADIDAFVERVQPVWKTAITTKAQQRLVDDIGEMRADYA